MSPRILVLVFLVDTEESIIVGHEVDPGLGRLCLLDGRWHQRQHQGIVEAIPKCMGCLSVVSATRMVGCRVVA